MNPSSGFSINFDLICAEENNKNVMRNVNMEQTCTNRTVFRHELMSFGKQTDIQQLFC